MNIEEIEKFLRKQDFSTGNHVKVTFRQRDPIYGLFVEYGDYTDLKIKNYWRIVRKRDMELWSKSKSIDLTKIFSGSEFSRLSVVQE